MRAAALLAALLVAGGCGRYWVSERALDAYALTPPRAQKRVIVPATRVDDGRATFVRASEARLLPVVDGGRRQVRVLRPMTVAGAALFVGGLAWLGASLAVMYGMPNESSCPTDPCNLGKTTLFGTFAAEGATTTLTGGIMLIVGASTNEVPPGRRGYATVRD